MKVYRFDTLSSLDDLRMHEEDKPSPQRGEILISIKAVSLNFRDIAMVLGRYPQPCQKGLIPVSDAAGEITEVGEGVTLFKQGDRVMGTFHPRWFGGRPPTTLLSDGYGSLKDGWLSEFKVVSQEAVVKIPENISYEEASTLPCAGVTAWTALTGGLPIRAGHSVLVQGTGGVSIFALQLGKAVGATVIATTSSASKVERLRALGADEVINYKEEREWGERVRSLTGGRGVDRVVEVGGPATFSQSMRAVKYGGEIASIGFLSKENPGIDFFKLKESGAVIRQVAVGNREGLEELANVISAKNINPAIDRVFKFKDAIEAFAYLESGSHFGKIVIRL